MMTFQEVFKTGLRFKLPKNSTGFNSWAEGFYWQRHDDEHVLVIDHKEIININTFTNTYYNNYVDKFGIFFRLTDEWILHPEDAKQHGNA